MKPYFSKKVGEAVEDTQRINGPAEAF